VENVERQEEAKRVVEEALGVEDGKYYFEFFFFIYII
tara:strand:+ start:44 stop:154 length:111 start_codon:yes stop_codon:yes gene_type:complete